MDPLKQLLLQKMMAEPSQEGSEPSFADSAQSPPNLLDMGVEGIRGLLAGFIPGMETPNTPGGKIGEILGVAAPMAGAVGRAGASLVGQTGKRTLKSGPAVNELLGELLEFQAPETSLQQALSASKATGVRVPPAPKINVPAGLVGPPGGMKRDPGIQARFERQQVNDAQVALRKPLVSGGRSGKTLKTGTTNASKKLNEEMVREIRKMAHTRDLQDIYTKYPDVAKATLRDVVNGDSWHWVK